MSDIQARLKELRKEKDLTQKQVADETGLSYRGYQNIEYGVKEPTLSRLLTLSTFFNVSIDYLVGKTDNPEMNKFRKECNKDGK